MVPQWDCQPDSRTSAAVQLPPQGAQKEELVRPNSSDPEAQRLFQGPGGFAQLDLLYSEHGEPLASNMEKVYELSTHGDYWNDFEKDLDIHPSSRIAFDARSVDSEIAIDDFSTTSLECHSVETFRCDFDDGVCDVFIQSLSDDADWKTRVDSDPQLVGPERDHTGKSEGQYLYSDFKNAADGDEAILMSPRINTTADQSCLVFWYALIGMHPAGSLRINVSSPDLTDQRTVWSVSRGLHNDQPAIWTRAAITLDTSKPTRIILWGKYVDGSGAFSIDDMELSKGHCLSERDVNRQFSCSFEEPDLCGLGQMIMEDDIDWMWHSGESPSSRTGPSSDHTTGVGYYLYVESSHFRTPGDRAVLYTPTIHPTFPVSCLTLYIHMYGVDTNRLSIYQANSSSEFSLDMVEEYDGEVVKGWFESTTELKTTEPYKIFIEGLSGHDSKGDIGIDDMKIENKECMPVLHKLTCRFEECSFVQWHLDDFDWTYAGRVRRSAGPGPSYSPHSEGSYMYIDVDGTRSPGDSAVLVSHVMHTLSTQQSCLVFKYHLHGAFVGQLTLQLADPFLESNVTVWSVDRETGDRWNRAAFSIDTADPVRLLFVGTVGTGTGDIAVDDVTLRKGSCPYKKPPVARFKCDFEDPDLCWFRQDPDTSDIDWLWQTGPTPDGPDTGPAGDHTTGQGHYVYIESSPPQNALEKAVLYSPDIAMGAPEQCLTFWYSMSGAHIGELEVMKDSTSLLRIKGDQGLGWKKASLTLEMDPSKEVFQLSWHGKVGPGDKGDIAIDDIELSLMPCPTEPESVNCTFSDSHRCGYTQPDKNDMDWIQSEGLHHEHVWLSVGLFVYVEKELFPKAVLVSRTLDWDVRDNCLKFDYSMVGETIGRLNVYLASAENLNDRMLIWTRDTADATMWQNVEYDFELAFPQKIIFEAVRGSGHFGDIAIDNVKVLPHKCQTLTCDFTDGWCGFDEVRIGKYNTAWLTGSGVDSPHISDHTNGKDGKYLSLVIADASSFGLLGTYNLTAESHGEVCLAFWYRMALASPGSLTVFTADPEDHTVNRNDLWKRRTVGEYWSLAEVNINTTEPVYFEGHGSDTHKDFLALDDISVRRQPCGSIYLWQYPADCNFDGYRCGYTELNRDRLLARWIQKDGATPTASTGPDEDSPLEFSGRYIYMETTLPEEGTMQQTSILISPELTDTPRRICLRFWYHMQGNETGTLVVALEDSVSGVTETLWSADGDRGTGWQLAEVDVDVMKPSKIKFATVIDWSDGNQQLFGNVGLDDVEVVDGTCYPVPWTEEWRFRCDRSSTQCVGGQGQCNAATLLCDCEQGFHGPQCQYTSGGSACVKYPCHRGDCYNDTVCVCPDGYYGDMCEHKMVQVECTRDKMVVNVFPYGFTDLASWNIKHPENAKPSCKLQPVNQLGAHGSNGWQGFVGEFLHKNDPCAGSATVEEETVEWITFSRDLLVYTDPLGRHISDTKVNVNCTVENLPEPHLAVDVKELGRRRKNSAGDVRVLTFIEILFTLNIPNRETMTEIKVMDCTASNGVHTVTVVKNGCAMYPVGVMVYDGRQRGTEFLILQVYKKPSAPLALHFKCSVRLCDSRVDFFCYERAQCFQRVKRSARLDGEELKGNRIDVEYTYHLRP
ncbi:MAM and LDL-receptor class A domain-containing protein 1-like [Babylonia areolata]|uniref:MAM and LDL-receptor class A domain-containing protein 1-like n=1 Tax=Babylonia areolata TaxID=304850 RepID=UPI003FCFAD39